MFLRTPDLHKRSSLQKRHFSTKSSMSNHRPLPPAVQSGLLLVLALTLLYPLPALYFEWGGLVELYKGYGFLPELLLLLSAMCGLSFLIAQVALKTFRQQKG